MDVDELQLARTLNEHPEIILREGARRWFDHFVTRMKPSYQVTPFHQSYMRILEMFAKGQIKNLII